MVRLPIGTVIMLTDKGYEKTRPKAYAVVVDPTCGHNFKDSLLDRHHGFTRILECDSGRVHAIAGNGGWWVNDDTYTYEIIPEDQIPEEIVVLAMRCLLDRNFVPFAEELNRG
jgi:hypothetical protein